MFRFAWIGLLITAIAGCNAFMPYESVVTGPRAAVQIKTNFGKLGVIVFEPDANCKFTFMGRTVANMIDPAPTIYLPPGRAYLRVSPDIPNTVIGLDDVSFVLEDGQSYLIEFNKLGTSVGWTGAKIEYAFKYLNTSSEFPAPVTVDHFDVCKRQRG